MRQHISNTDWISTVKAPFTLVHYVIYCTRSVVSMLIQHAASPRAVSASRPHPSYHKSRNVLATVL